MKKIFSLYVLLFSLVISAQTDYSASWEDFYSYNNVKDFTKVDTIIYALTDNAIFTYDVLSGEINKISSIQGLSGETTSAIYYNETFKRVVIGYENGLVEVIDDDGSITISSDIVNFNQSGEKSINHISEFNNKLYLSTPFAVVVYDIENLEFGDTYFIGNNSSSVKINETIISNNVIYAATEVGVFKADIFKADDITSNLLIDFNNWQLLFPGDFKGITTFENVLYVIKGSELVALDGINLGNKINFLEEIKGLKASTTHLSVSLDKEARIYDSSMNLVQEFIPNLEYDYTLNTAFFEADMVFLATKEFGILETTISEPITYLEIHPDGPLSNAVFSITAQNNNFWVVYGGYDSTNTPLNIKNGFSEFNGENWINTNFNSSLPNDLVDVTIDPSHENRVYISALGESSNIEAKPSGGLLVVEDNVLVQTYNHLNSSLTPILISLPAINIRVSGSAFDSSGNLWATNYETGEELVKLSANGQWSSVDLGVVQTSLAAGLTEVIVDRNNSIWIGSRRNGAYVYNENGNRKKALIATPNEGNLPDLNVRTIAVDRSNRIWLGTKSGLVVYSNASGVFDEVATNAQPVVINGDENGFGDRLLGDQTINSIVVDGADNKWFGTDSGGVLCTNPSGQTTIAIFSKKNSPLPSNRILKISVDKAAGKVYFATDKGIVAYNSNVAPFGDVLEAVYAFPNPALNNHETVTIDGRNGTHLPKGTNVKILDVAGNLVHETNVVEGQELQGGKVVWNKRNLAGNKVASGIYIVLLSNDDASETAVTKIAIIN
ncbi:two-component regulator propeller domain-containing protein [uncultured Polaribacter sp.]|uniref:type IX secretion system anionic LPS delivery protein PorZ n=1 Tax=uncultured Polaribacter sp. TaxID=174711 RepID=UPI0037039692